MHYKSDNIKPSTLQQPYRNRQCWYCTQAYIHAHELRSIIEEFGVGVEEMAQLKSQMQELGLPDRCKVGG